MRPSLLLLLTHGSWTLRLTKIFRSKYANLGQERLGHRGQQRVHLGQQRMRNHGQQRFLGSKGSEIELGAEGLRVH